MILPHRAGSLFVVIYSSLGLAFIWNIDTFSIFDFHQHHQTVFMKSTKIYDIAIIFPDWYHFLHDVMEGVLEIPGVRHHCHFRNFISTDFNEPVEFPKGYQPDGILVSYDDSYFDASWLADYGVPVVNIFSSNKNPNQHSYPTVGVDPKSLTKIIVGHFDALGFKCIGVLGTKNQTYLSDFYRFFIEECKRKKLPHWYVDIPDGINAGCWTQLEEYAPDLKNKLLHPEKRTGIYATHDMRGRLIADYCTDLGVRVPEDIGILGRFDSINARLCTPELSSVVMPAKQIGARAIQLLINQIEKNPIEDLYPMVDANEIRVRKSTVGSSSPDIIALQARTIIRENACKGLTVDELIQALPIARSTFEKRYQALTGATPAAEIRKIRMDKARQLLLTSTKTIDEIAFEVGFTDPRPFVVFFKREVKQTPGEFRNTHVK